MTEPAASVAADARPKLPRGVRLTQSEAHGGMVLLAPERVFKADAIAAAILERCTGEATFAEIVDALAAAYVIGSVVLSIAALFAGLWMIRSLYA